VKRSEQYALAAVVLAFATGYSLVGLFRHWHFGSSIDLGIFDQAVWHLSRFEAPVSTLSGYGNILSDHFYPIVALLAPLYWIVPSPETLLVVQALLLACSIVPVYLFLRDRLPAPAAWLLTATHGCFWGIQRVTVADVHELAAAPLLIAIVILAIDRRAYGLMWGACITLMFVKEDLIPFVSGVGLYLIYLGERRIGALLFVGSLAGFAAVMRVIIPWFGEGTTWRYTSAYQSAFDRPWAVPLLLFTPAGKLLTVLYWLAPFAFLPLYSPISALLLPVALERLLSDNSIHWGHGFHYSAPLAPILTMAAGDALSRLVKHVTDPHARKRLLTVVPAVCLAVSIFLPGHQPLLRAMNPKHYEPLPTDDTARRALSLIPPTASVVAQASVAPHLTQRERIFVLRAEAPEADFVIASEDLDPWPTTGVDEIRRLMEDRKRRGYSTALAADGWIVLKR
jgi:uncharacterized membrane protein